MRNGIFPSPLSVALAVILSVTGSGALAADTDGSLDSMWSDQPKSAEGAAASYAPLCSLDSFRQSDLVLNGAWSGVGPFKGTGTTLIDQDRNTIKLNVDKSSITGAELSVNDSSEGLLKLEMSADFLLESLGARAAKVADFNAQLEKEKARLSAADQTDTVNLQAGRYLVYIHPTQTSSYKIRINSRDAGSEAIKQPVPETGTKPAKPNTDVATTHGAPPPSVPVNLKDQFLDLVNSWQRVKKTAVKDRNASALADVLSGAALTMQSNAIKWLQDHNSHYEVDAKSVVIDHYVELIKDRKYAVYSLIKESSKYINDASGQVMKDTTDVYNVNYTVEKINGHWFITDSAIVQPAKANAGEGKTTQQTPKTPGKDSH